MKKIGLSFFLIAFCGIFAIAQNPSKWREEATELQKAGRYRTALATWQRYLSSKPTDADATLQAAIAAYHSNQLALAKDWLTTLSESNPKLPAVVHLYRGRIAHYEFDLKNAIIHYKNFLRNAKSDDPNRRIVVEHLKHCATARGVLRQPELALVENLGEAFNSEGDDFAPVQSPNYDDRLYFTSARASSDGGLRNEEGLTDEKKGKYTTDIFFSDLDGSDWSTPQAIPSSLITTSRNERLYDFNATGQAMLFFRGLNLFSGDILIDTFRKENETRLEIPSFQSPFRPQEGDADIMLFNDTAIIFSSRRAGGFGGLDLYVSQFSEGAWSTPKNLGPEINTPYDEVTPFLAHNGRTLYFSSNNTQSIGGFDIFTSRFDEDSLRWGEPKNLGRPINSAGDDLYFRLVPNGSKGYFTSDRKDGFGGQDILTAILLKARTEEQTPSVPTLFTAITERKANIIDTLAEQNKIVTYDFVPFYYETDDDLLKRENLRQLTKLAELGRQFSDVQITLVGNCAEGERTSIDLYFTVKKLEKMAKWLIENGVKRESIILKSIGNSFPKAKNTIEGEINTSGRKLNQRIDIVVKHSSSRLVVNMDTASVSEFMRDERSNALTPHLEGLTYKIQVAAIKRMYENEVLENNKSGGMIETFVPSEGTPLYQYTIGLFTKFEEAEKMRQKLITGGAKDVWIVPYLKGSRITSDEEARRLANRYSDLHRYLTRKK